MLHVGTVILDEHVGLRDEPLEHFDTARALEVQRHRALVAVEVLEVEALAGGLVVVLVLHLDDVGAHLRELTHARGSGARPREIDDGVRLERQGHVGLRIVGGPDATTAGEESPGPPPECRATTGFYAWAGVAWALRFRGAGVQDVDELRREFWQHKTSAHVWAVEVSGRDESLLACCGPFTPRTARVLALDELAYGRGATL